MLLCQQPHISAEICGSEAMTSLQAFVGELLERLRPFFIFASKSSSTFSPILTNVHNLLRFCDLCKEFSFSDRSRCHGEGRVRSPSGPSILAAHNLRPHRRTGRLGDPALPIQPNWMSNSLRINSFHRQFLESHQTLESIPLLCEDFNEKSFFCH